ncbi:hypothetical protein SAMN05446635_6743 [Burkholderia sp. OK233]|nr:hypothetical protein SAMN05446635_6743 [Burkholderia sp. OK233]
MLDGRLRSSWQGDEPANAHHDQREGHLRSLDVLVTRPHVRCDRRRRLFAEELAGPTYVPRRVPPFAVVGGVPREILYDRMKTAVLGEIEKDIVYNAKLVAFAQHYSFAPRACKAYRAETTGKVERPYRYVRQDFFLARRFQNLGDMNPQLREWLDKVTNVRLHGTTHRVVAQHFSEERRALQTLSAGTFNGVIRLSDASATGGSFPSAATTTASRIALANPRSTFTARLTGSVPTRMANCWLFALCSKAVDGRRRDIHRRAGVTPTCKGPLRQSTASVRSRQVLPDAAALLQESALLSALLDDFRARLRRQTHRRYELHRDRFLNAAQPQKHGLFFECLRRCSADELGHFCAFSRLSLKGNDSGNFSHDDLQYGTGLNPRPEGPPVDNSAIVGPDRLVQAMAYQTQIVQNSPFLLNGIPSHENRHIGF